MLPTPEHINLIAGFRQKASDGTLTVEEMKSAIILMRAGRASAAVTASARAKASSTKAKKPPRSAADMLDELDG